MEMWAAHFADRRPEHYVFPSEKYGAGNDDFKPCVYGTDPTKPLNDWKEALGGSKKARRRCPAARTPGRCAHKNGRGRTSSTAMSIPRSEAHRVHPAAGGRGSLSYRRDNYGMERFDRDPHGEALRTHRSKSPAPGDGVIGCCGNCFRVPQESPKVGAH
jgi:hypothetical protein